MEGLAGAVLGETLIHMRDDEDRRAAERRLVRDAQNGDLLAFERLYRENERKVFALCLRMSSDAALAEELTQEVFVRAWRKLGELPRGERLLLLALPADGERGAQRAPVAAAPGRADLRDRRPGEPGEGAGHAAARRRASTCEKAMATLPPGARAVFVLHDVEGRTHDEIAAMLNLATGTSKAQLFRARRLLREALGS